MPSPLDFIKKDTKSGNSPLDFIGKQNTASSDAQYQDYVKAFKTPQNKTVDKAVAKTIAEPSTFQKYQNFFSSDFLSKTKFFKEAAAGLNVSDSPDNNLGVITLRKAASLVGGASPENLPIGFPVSIGQMVSSSKDFIKNQDPYLKDVTFSDFITGIKETGKSFIASGASGAIEYPSIATAGLYQPEISFNLPGIGEITNSDFKIARRVENGEDPIRVVLEEKANGFMNALFFLGIATKPFLSSSRVIAKRVKNEVNLPKDRIITAPKARSFRPYSEPKFNAPIGPEYIQKIIDSGEIKINKYNPKLPTYFRMVGTSKGKITGEIVQVKPSFFSRIFKGDVTNVPKEGIIVLNKKTADVAKIENAKPTVIPPIVPPIIDTPALPKTTQNKVDITAKKVVNEVSTALDKGVPPTDIADSLAVEMGTPPADALQFVSDIVTSRKPPDVPLETTPKLSDNQILSELKKIGEDIKKTGTKSVSEVFPTTKQNKISDFIKPVVVKEEKAVKENWRERYLQKKEVLDKVAFLRAVATTSNISQELHDLTAITLGLGKKHGSRTFNIPNLIDDLLNKPNLPSADKKKLKGLRKEDSFEGEPVDTVNKTEPVVLKKEIPSVKAEVKPEPTKKREEPVQKIEKDESVKITDKKGKLRFEGKVIGVSEKGVIVKDKKTDIPLIYAFDKFTIEKVKKPILSEKEIAEMKELRRKKDIKDKEIAEIEKDKVRVDAGKALAERLREEKTVDKPVDTVDKIDNETGKITSFQMTADMGGLAEAKPSTVDEQVAEFKALGEQHGVKIPFEVVDTIYTPDGGMAHGALFEHKVFFSKESVLEDTGFHELLHEAMQSPEIFDVLKGIKMPEIIKAANGGKKPVNEYERNLAEENIEQMAREYILKNNKRGIPKILIDFLEKLKILLTRIYRAFGGKVDVIKDFIRLMKYSRTKNINRLEVTVNDAVYDKVTMNYVNGLRVLDFSKLPEQEAELSFLQIGAALQRKYIRDEKGRFSRLRESLDENFMDNVFGMNISEIILDKEYYDAVEDIRKGQGSMTDLPVLVKETKEGGKFNIIDGRHRVAETLINGGTKVKAMTDEALYNKATKKLEVKTTSSVAMDSQLIPPKIKTDTVNGNDIVTLFHATSKTNAANIRRGGVIRPGLADADMPGRVFLTPNKERALEHGEEIISVKLRLGDKSLTNIDGTDFIYDKPLKVQIRTKPPSFQRKTITQQNPLNFTKLQGELHAKVIAVSTDLSNGVITKEEAGKKIKALWDRMKDTLTSEQKTKIFGRDLESKLQKKFYDAAKVSLQAKKIVNAKLPVFKIKPETRADVVNRKIIEMNTRIKVMQEELTKQGVTIGEDTDVYLHKTLLKRKIGDQFRRAEQVKKDFVEGLVSDEITIEEMDSYSRALYAPTYNKLMIERGTFEGDNASGITSKEAQDILDAFEAGGKTKLLEKNREILRSIQRASLALDIKNGLRTLDEVKGMVSIFGNDYVPQSRDMGDDGGISGMVLGKKGVDVRGKESKRAKGSEREVLPVTAQIFNRYAQSFIRGEKNKVGQVLLKFIEDNNQQGQMNDLFSVNRQEYIPRFDSNGELLYMDPKWMSEANIIGVKVEGKQYYIKMKDHRFATAMKETDVVGGWNMGAKFIRYLSSMITFYSPSFMLRNSQRDFFEGMINLRGIKETQMTKEQSKNLTREVALNVPKMIKGLFAYKRGKSISLENSKLFDRFEKAGGEVGYFWTQDIKEVMDNLEKIYKQVENKGIYKLTNKVKVAGDFIGHANEAVELGIRVSTFDGLTKHGMSDKKAAAIAGDLTVDFNKGGEYSPLMKSLYLFINPAIQGPNRMWRALKSSRGVKKLAAGLVVAGFINGIISIMLGGDGDSNIPQYKKNSRIIFATPEGKEVTIFYLPWGYSAFWAFGRNIAEATYGKKGIGEAIGDTTIAAIDAFNPLGGSQFSISNLVPSIAKPFVEIGLNKNWTGAPINPGQPEFSARVPDSTLYWKNVSDTSKFITTMLNKYTGGSELKSGFADISPESIDHLVKAYTGTVGSEIQRIADLTGKVTTGKMNEIKPSNIPIVRDYYQDINAKMAKQQIVYPMYKESARTEFNALQTERFNGALDYLYQNDYMSPDYAKKMRKEFKNNQHLVRTGETIEVSAMKSAIKKIKSGANKKEAFNNLVTELEGDNPSKTRVTKLRKNINVYNEFGFDNEIVNELLKGGSNDKKVKLLQQYKKDAGEDAFKKLVNKGRKEIKTSSGNKTEMLISDDLFDMLKNL